MPKKLHKRLKKKAKSKGLSAKRAAAYVHGTINKLNKSKSGYRGK